MINASTNSMCLQFVRYKCVKLHIGKKHNSEICSQLKADAWKDELVKYSERKAEMKYIFAVKSDMKDMKDKNILDTLFLMI